MSFKKTSERARARVYAVDSAPNSRFTVFQQNLDGTWRQTEVDMGAEGEGATRWQWRGPGWGYERDVPPPAPFSVCADGLIDLHPSQWSVS